MDRRVPGRVILLALGFALFSTALAARLYDLQIAESPDLRERARRQHERRIEVWPRRGVIVDRRGRELAVSLTCKSLFAHPAQIRNPEHVARRLAPVLGMRSSTLLRRLRSDEPFVWLRRRLDPDRANALRRTGLRFGAESGLGLESEARRFYPLGTLAAHVLGCTNLDQKGIEGVELAFDGQLRGDPIRYLALRDGLGWTVVEKVRAPSRRPRDVVLTLDATIQHLVERELERAVRESGARAGTAVFLDPASGQVLAMANVPTVDPNRAGRYPPAHRRNRAVTDLFEPGSTFKVVVAAAALEAGVVRENDWFDCGHGRMVLAGRTIRDHKPFDRLTFRQVLERSSNVGMVRVAWRLPQRRLYDSLRAFGFGERTGIELPGEVAGSLRPTDAWTPHTHASIAFGHEIGVTAVQMASAFATLANGGVRVPPRLVLGTRDENGRFEPAPSPAGRPVISPATARRLASLLEGVVARGTGRLAQVDGYAVAGKTGTAQKYIPGKGYSDTEYVASFGGFAPVREPRIAGIIVLDTPRGPRHTGGAVAAPAFGRIVAETLAYLRVPTEGATFQVARPVPPGSETPAVARRPGGRGAAAGGAL